MPELLAQVRRLAERAAALTAQRDDAIRQARAAGASLRELAAAAGVSHQTVSNICDR